MRARWRDVVEELAGPDADLTEFIDHDLDDMVVARAVIPNALLSGLGHTPDQAWRSLAHSLGDFRLLESLDAAGWTLVEEVIVGHDDRADQVAFVEPLDTRDSATLLAALKAAD